MKISQYHVVLIVLIAVTTGSVLATSTFQPGGNTIDGSVPVIVDGDATIKEDLLVNGQFQVDSTRGGSAITVKNSGAFNSIKLWDVDDGQIFQFRLIGTGERLDIVDITHNRVDMAILSSNGNVGIQTASPSEELDVNGNIRVRGDIVSTTDLNISPSGDLCLGSGCS